MRIINYFLISIFAFIGCIGCKSVDNELRVTNEEKFQVKFIPAFHESSEITFTREMRGGRVNILLFKRNSGDKPIDTVRIVSQPISELIYDELQREVFLPTKQLRSSNFTGCCDGMPIWYLVIKDGDTSVLFLRSPSKSTDSAGYVVTARALNHMRKFVIDSAILKHFADVETYLD